MCNTFVLHDFSTSAKQKPLKIYDTDNYNNFSEQNFPRNICNRFFQPFIYKYFYPSSGITLMVT